MNKAIDKDWFKIYENGCTFDDIDYLKFNQEKLAKQKELFLTGLIDEPALAYNVDLPAVLQHKTKLLELLEMVNSDNTVHSAVKKAYQLKITDQLNKVALLEAVARQDDKAMAEASKLLYGEPNKETFRQVLSVILYLAKQRHFILGEKWDKLAEYFGAVSDGSDIDYEFSPDQNYLATEELVELFQEALSDRNIPWQVQVSPSVLAITLSYRDKAVLIPENRKDTKTAVQALIEHEIGVHLARHYNGLSSPLLLLSVGLDSYIGGEEGLAAYKQIQVDKGHLPGIINYLCIGLVFGLYDGKEFSFRQIFDLCKEYNAMNGISENQVEEESWKRCLRTFRGTAGQAGKNVFTRDLTYFSGYLKIKEIIDNNNPETNRLFVGKYDPSNLNHIDILNQLGIS